MTGCKLTMNLLSRTSFDNSYSDAYWKTKKLADDIRNAKFKLKKFKLFSYALVTIPKGKPMHVTINNSDGRQQALAVLVTTHHTNSMIYLPKLVTHPAEGTNRESSTEYMGVEPSEGSSLCGHMILVINMHLRFICFRREMTQRVKGLEQDQNHIL